MPPGATQRFRGPPAAREHAGMATVSAAQQPCIFQDMMSTNPEAFWRLPDAAKEQLSPETLCSQEPQALNFGHQVSWMPLHVAVQHCLVSMTEPVKYVNDYQRSLHSSNTQKDPAAEDISEQSHARLLNVMQWAQSVN
eukprot:5800824-Amphidinium_carterae.1